MKRTTRYFVSAFIILFLASCTPSAVVQVQPPPEKKGTIALRDISDGLPKEGQWRENIALYDMNRDGYLDIIAPPPRDAEKGNNVPHIFLRDQKEGKWKEGVFTFPSLKDYGYGGIAIGDLNGDDNPDIALAVHEGRIIVLENNGGNGFVEKTFPAEAGFHSRTVGITDINADGSQDIIALSEAPFLPPYDRPRGILAGLNKEGKDWDLITLDGSALLFGDSMAVGDIKGDGNKDVIIAPLVNQDVKFVWFGDGKGNFKFYDGNLIDNDKMAFFVRTGDVDGEGKDEAVFKVSQFGQGANVSLAAYKWAGDGFEDISKGLEGIKGPIVFDLADTDGDGRKELVVLAEEGLSIYKYTDKGWAERGYYQLPHEETIGASDLRCGRNRDGSLLIAYNLGRAGKGIGHGIRVYLLKGESPEVGN